MAGEEGVKTLKNEFLNINNLAVIINTYPFLISTLFNPVCSFLPLGWNKVEQKWLGQVGPNITTIERPSLTTFLLVQHLNE